jgi:anti-sigma regulatory factor (Ser/Thr protein kinase)
VHVIGEIALRDGGLDAEWIRYEAACNEIFSDVALRATCLYPRAMHTDALSAVAATHPLVDDGELVHSDAYRGAHAACAHIAPQCIAPTRPPDLSVEHLAEPRRARRAVIDAMLRDGRADASENAGLVVSELVTNSIVHGGGHATVALWLQPSTVIVAVNDEGAGIDDPFAGLWPPALPDRGAGLWVANYLSQRISIERSPLGGAAVTAELAAPRD